MKLSVQAKRLVLVAITGQVLAWFVSILMARRLSLAGFEAYVLASAIFILLASLAPRGAEKYTLRQFPALVQRQDWGLAHGLIRFSTRRTLVTAVVAALLIAGWAMIDAFNTDETRRAIIVTCVALPGGALVHYALELLSAAGRPLSALAIFRVAVPGLVLMLSGLWLASGLPFTGPVAVGSWGVAWLVALAAMAASLIPAVDRRVRSATPVADVVAWRRESRPFFAYRAALALLGQAGLIALGLLTADTATGAYAAAMATVNMAAVLATATNRAYGREMALLLEQHDFAALLRLRHERMRWLVPAVTLFLTLTLGFPATILSLFRAEFAATGTTPLRLLALSTAFTVLFSLAPTYLKFQKRNRLTYTVVAIAAVTQLLLLALLVPTLGATGAALAYAASMIGMYGSFAVFAHQEVLRLRALS